MKTIITTSKVYGTNAERLAMNLGGENTEIHFYETDTGNEYTWKGSVWENSIVNVSTTPSGISHIREKLALDGTAVTFDWSATPIKAVIIKTTADTAGTAELLGSIVICIDPSNSAIRDAWLTEGTSLAADTQRIPIKVGDVEEITFTSPVSYIGLKRDDGTETIRVFAIGVEA